MSEVVNRFTGLSETYHKYRPRYPREIIDLLKDKTGLTPKDVIGDIGSGTGLSCKPFLDNGNLVYGIEPNPEMRKIAERELKQYSNYFQLPGTAENPGLPENCVDYVIAGQSFHWFDLPKAKKALRSILKEHGKFVIIWQEKVLESLFMQELEGIIQKYAVDYSTVDFRLIGEEQIRKFYSPYRFKEASIPYEQVFDREGLKGRLLSCSYLPVNSDAPGHKAMLTGIDRLFETSNVNGEITIPYQFKMYFGRFK